MSRRTEPGHPIPTGRLRRAAAVTSAVLSAPEQPAITQIASRFAEGGAIWYQAEPHKPFDKLPDVRDRLPTFRRPFQER